MFFFYLLILFSCFSQNFSQALESNYNHSTIKIVPDQILLSDDNYFYFGIEINLEKDWKTYWKNPGDAGAPITIEFDNNQGILEKKILFPFPEKFVDKSITTIGYENRVIFPIRLKLNREIEEINTNITLQYLVCKEVCIPLKSKHKIEYFLKDANLNFKESIIYDFFQKVPLKNSGYFSLESKVFFKTNKIELSLKNFKNKNIKAFAYSDDVNFSTNVRFRDKNHIISLYANESLENIKSPISLVISDGLKYKEIILDNLKNDFGKKPYLFNFLILAFLGGLILNFMPCVLPVLSLKLLSLVKIGSEDAIKVKNNIISIVLGIFTSFLFLSLFIITMKFLGHSIGWGFQFQNLYFLVFITTIVFIFSLNLLGFFEIILPVKLFNNINEYINSNKTSGYYFSGVFATLMATPCSAPFLGTAIGFSAITSNLNILMIFISVALGFSLPYLLIFLNPKFLKIIPKPGQWMDVFKFILGLILLATSGWLMKLSGIDEVFILIIILLVTTLSLILFFNIKKLFTSLIFSIVIFLFLIKPFQNTQKQNNWVDFDEQILNLEVSNDKVLLLDLTADWCITCQINKQTTLENEDLIEFLKSNNILLMRGDWTKPNDKILNFIKKNGRLGIPLNIIYGPRKKNGILLPEILTKDLIIDNIMLVK